MAQLSIGLDIGHHHVRAIALARATAAQTRAGAAARVVAIASVPRLDHDGGLKPLAATLAEVETLLGRRGALTVHLSDANTLVRFVPTLPLPPDRRQRLLRLELTQHADEAGDLAADAWEVPIPGEEIVHGCVISQPSQVLAGLQALRTAHLGSARLAYGPAAIANTAFAANLVSGDDLALVVDIGATVTSVTLVGDQRLLACRQLSIGGDTFTEALMVRGIDHPAAERRKLSGEAPGSNTAMRPAASTVATAVSQTAMMALDGEETAAVSESGAEAEAEALEPPGMPSRKRVADATFDALFEDEVAAPPAQTKLSELPPAGESTDDHIVLELDDSEADRATALGQIAPTTPPLPLPGSATISLGRKALGADLQRTAEAFYAQLASSVLWFRTQLRLPDLNISKVSLTGGGAALEGLDTYLQRRFNCPVTILDPLAHLAADKIRIPHDGPAWATAVGLALATPTLGGKQAVILDLRPESLVRRDFRARYQIWPYIAAGLTVAASAVAGWVLHEEQLARQASIAAYGDWKSKREDLVKKLAALDADKDAQAEDLRSIAGRIYAGRDLLFAVRALKEQTKDSPELWITKFETRGVGAPDQVDGQSPNNAATNAPANSANKAYDTAIDRGALLLSGRVKFTAAPTLTGLDEFLNKWSRAIGQWKPQPDAPTLFLEQRMDEWDPKRKTSSVNASAKPAAEGEFPFKFVFTFRPTQLDQITEAQQGPEKP